jgi:hypothetical protein
MCRSLRVLCAAPGGERLDQLRRSAVAANWELVGGADSVDALGDQIAEWRPDVVVLDAGLGEHAVVVARGARPSVRIVGVGQMFGTDAEAASLDEVRGAILGLPRPGGPVRA